MDAWNERNKDVGKDLLKGTAIAGKLTTTKAWILNPVIWSVPHCPYQTRPGELIITLVIYIHGHNNTHRCNGCDRRRNCRNPEAETSRVIRILGRT
jgi:hypothetical protein